MTRSYYSGSSVLLKTGTITLGFMTQSYLLLCSIIYASKLHKPIRRRIPTLRDTSRRLVSMQITPPQKPKIATGQIGSTTKSTFGTLFLLLAAVLLILPFITTFNEFLTSVVMKIKLYRLIQDLIVPYQVKMITVILRLFGMTVYPGLTTVSFGRAIGQSVEISWNCIGWQSLILLIISLFTGLQGPYRIYSKFQTVVIGFLGTFLVNLIRITLVILITYYFGRLPGMIFHDYFSTIMIIAWLFFFWWFSFSFVLEKHVESPEEG